MVSVHTPAVLLALSCFQQGLRKEVGLWGGFLAPLLLQD